jgi:hypothetical protein
MQRRAYLATVAAGAAVIAGCSGLGPTDDSSDTTTPTPDGQPPTDTRDRGGPRDPPESPASVIDFAVQPYTVALSPTRFHTDDGAEVALRFDRTATEEHPARLTGYLANRNDFENTFRIEWTSSAASISALEGIQP